MGNMRGFTKEALKKGSIAAVRSIKEKAIARREDYNSHPDLCIRCKKPLTYEQHSDHCKFCSTVCSNIARGTKRKTEKICLYCGTSLTKKSQTVYCGQECATKGYRESKFQQHIQDGRFPTPAAARRYLLYYTGNVCNICGVVEWMGKPVPLVMDHINGDSDDHSVSNCRLICRNCDGLLPTYCNGNKGRGGSRSKRRLKDYYAGKKNYRLKSVK